MTDCIMDEEHVKISVPKLYRRGALDLLMFGFVRGVKAALPSLTTHDCLILFQKKIAATDKAYPLESARTIYNRMQEEFIDNETNCFRQ